MDVPTPEFVVGEGSLRRLPIGMHTKSGELSVVSAPTSVLVAVENDILAQTHVLVVKAGYGAPETGVIRLRSTCGTETAVAEVPLRVRRLRWAPTISWQGAAGPPAREHTLMWVDPSNPDRALLYGGYGFVPQQFTHVFDSWALNLTDGTWSQPTQTGSGPQLAGGRVSVVGDGAFILGGDNSSQSTPYSLTRVQMTSGLTWTPDTNSTGPGGILGSLVYDEPRHRLISACGITGGSVIHCNVYAFDVQNPASGWTKLPVAPGPTGRYGFVYGMDEANHRLIVFSGAGAPTGTDPVNANDETWSLDLSLDTPVWTRLSSAGSVPRRRNACFAVDAANQRLILWGGTPDAQSSVGKVAILDLEKGFEKWRELTVPGEPTPRSSCTGLFDAARNRVLFGFGNSSTGKYTELAVLEL